MKQPLLKAKIEKAKLTELCSKHKMFTFGTNWHRERMFELAHEGITKVELAFMLYQYSDYKFNTICSWIAPLFQGGELHGI